MNSILILARLQRRVFVVCFLLVFSVLLSAQLPSGFSDAKIQSGYAMPMGVAFSKNGQKMFVWEKKGTIWLSNWNGSTYVKQSTVVLDIGDEAGNWRDLGLHSVALDPNFDSNGLIYLFYHVDRHHLMNFGTPQYSSTTDDYFKASIARVTRYKVNNSGTITADKASRKVLIGESKTTGIPVLFESHAGGQLIFGADGTLFVTTGDNANFTGTDVGNDGGTFFQQAISDGIMRAAENVGALRAQMVNSYCGKLLRIDPNTGDGLSSNPFYNSGNPRSPQSRVWAIGFRNPYRMCLKVGTGSSSASSGNPGTIIVGDVGNGSAEEIQVVDKAGLNCGWPVFEGLLQAGGYYDASANVQNQDESGRSSFQSLCKAPTSLSVSSTINQRRFTHFPPALDWRHQTISARYPDFSTGRMVPKPIESSGALVTGTSFQGNCVTMGTYYTGSTFPSAFQNVVFFADYGANWIKAASMHDNSDHQLHEVKSFAPDGYGKGIVDIEYCPVDESIVYININTGDIQKIKYGGSSNRSPVAAISANKTSGSSPLTINFSSSGSSDPDGDALTYSWDFGDGSSASTSANPAHTFTSSSSKGFTVTLTVKDSKGATDSKTMTVSINNSGPSVKITSPSNNSKYPLLGANSYTLKATVTDNDLTGIQYAWQVTLIHNNHEHREPILTAQSPTVQISPVGCDGDTYAYLIELTVKDNGGLTAKDAITLTPDCSTASLAIKNLSATAQQNAVALSWTNPAASFDEVLVVAKANSGFSTRPSGSSYTANSNFTSSSSSAFEGGKVVSKGTSTSVTVTNLTAGTKYAFRVFTRKGSAWTGGVEASATPTGSTPTPTPTGGFDPNKCYRFLSRLSQKAMAVAGGSSTRGTNIDQTSYVSGIKHQLWKLKANSDGTYRMVNANSGKVADISGSKTSAGAPVIQWDWTTGSNQRWFITKNSSGSYKIVAKHSNLSLDIQGGSTSSGAQLIQNTPNNNASQRWSIDEVTCPSGVVALESDNILTAEGYRDGKKAIITWVSNANHNKDYFEVQKLNTNQPVFERLELLNAQSRVLGTDDKQYYAVTDAEPTDGENFYRVALYRDGTTPPQYSEVITLDFSHFHDFTLFPNPANNYIDIDLERVRYRAVDITLTDATGQILKQQHIDSAPVTPVRMSLDGMQNGSYFMRIESEGKREVVKAFLIMR